MNEIDKTVLNIVNTWRSECEPIDEIEIEQYSYQKNKFKEKYFQKFNEYLNISKRVEAVCFKKIASALSKRYKVDDNLIDKYLDWCFDNYDFFIKKFNHFNLVSITSFSIHWKKELNDLEFQIKTSYDDISSLMVSQNVFYYCEQYGIPYVVTKLLEENPNKKNVLMDVFHKKLYEMTKSSEGISRIKNMLRKTVELGPYSKSIKFSNYAQDLKDYFKFFKSEPWCPK